MSVKILCDTFPPRVQMIENKCYSVIIIGAGVAGLAVADYLRDTKITEDVLVLEARERVGGRILTSLVGPAKVDIGASWIHGVKNNIVANFCLKNKINTKATDWNHTIIWKNNHPLDVSELQQYQKAICALDSDIENYQKRNYKKNDIPLQTVLDDIIGKLENRDIMSYYHHHIDTEMKINYAADPGQLSLLHFNQHQEEQGKHHCFQHGYIQVIEALAKGTEILVGREVVEVDYTEEGCTTLRTRSGEEFRAHLVVVTLPLGVLQSNTVKFNPPLPLKKLDSIKKLGISVLNKVILVFDKVFWGEEEFISFLRPEKPKLGMYCSFFQNQSNLVGHPVLVGFLECTTPLEAHGDDEVIKGLLVQLSEVYNVSNLVSYHVTRWHQDQFSRGSYSFIPVGATGKDYTTMAEPVENRIFFAGEATNRKFPSTVHGAFLSGIREAKQIEAILNKSKQ